jgi:hypothetical protein
MLQQVHNWPPLTLSLNPHHSVPFNVTQPKTPVDAGLLTALPQHLRTPCSQLAPQNQPLSHNNNQLGDASFCVHINHEQPATMQLTLNQPHTD